MAASTGGHLRLFGPGGDRLVGAAHRYQARPGRLGDPPERRRQPIHSIECGVGLGMPPGAAADYLGEVLREPGE